MDISSITESSCWYLVWLAGSSDPFCPIIGGKVIDIGVVGVEGAGGRDGVFEARCCVFDGVLDLGRPDDDDDYDDDDYDDDYDDDDYDEYDDDEKDDDDDDYADDYEYDDDDDD